MNRLLATTALLAGAACDRTYGIDRTADCPADDEPVPAVRVTVQDPQGVPATPERIEWYRWVSDTEEESGGCEPLDEGATRFACGGDETGWYRVEVDDGAYFHLTWLDVGMRLNGCHVLTRHWDVRLCPPRLEDAHPDPAWIDGIPVLRNSREPGQFRRCPRAYLSDTGA